MRSLGLGVPDVLNGAPGTVWVRLLAAATAMVCAGSAAWLLSARGHAARRTRSLFEDHTAAARARQGRAVTAARSAVRDGGDVVGHLTPAAAGAKGASKDTGGTGVGVLGKGRPWEHRPGASGSLGGRGGTGIAGVGVVRGYRIGAPAPLWRYAQPWPRAVVLPRRAGRHGAWCLLGGTAMAILGDSVLPLVLGLAALPVVWRAAKAGEARRERRRRADAVITLCGTLAGEVRAGRHAGEALLAVTQAADDLAETQAAVLAAARFGGDVPRALTSAADEPGAEGLLGLAACWRVAVDSGAGLAAGLERLEATLRAERNQRAELHAQLAGARSTAVLLAGLPALGLLLGTALGADPLHVLLHSGAGLGCLLVGGALEGTGLWWALRIARNGEGE